MPIAGGIALLIIGAILTFALTGTLHGIDLHVVGVILMLAGAAGLMLPLLARPRRGRERPVARSRQDAIDDGTLVELPGNDLTLDDERRAKDRRFWVRRGRG